MVAPFLVWRNSEADQRILRFLKPSGGSYGRSSAEGPPGKQVVSARPLRCGWGYRRIHILLRREGWVENSKRAQHLYRKACRTVTAALALAAPSFTVVRTRIAFTQTC